MEGVDALVMGRNTYNTIKGFGFWPYKKKVFVLSNTLKKEYLTIGDVEIIKGDLKNILKELNDKGYRNLYIDGGRTFQSFLEENLIDEITITTVPIILRDRIKLFGNLKTPKKLKFLDTEIFEESGIIKNHYKVL